MELKKAVRFYAVHLLLLIFILVNAAKALDVAGDISGHWTMDDSPVHVTENATVPDGEELTIDPGVTILFARDTWLSVRGLITAIGTEEDSIIFSADIEDAEPGYWSYIGVATNEESVLSYCVIEYARIGVAIGSRFDHRGEVAHSTIRHMSEKGVSMTNDRNEPYPRVHHCHIYNVISDEAEEGVGVEIVYGCGIADYNIVTHCTIGLMAALWDFAYYTHNVVAFNQIGFDYAWESNVTFTHNILYNNELMGHGEGRRLYYNCYLGNLEGWRRLFGRIVQINANGDSCDANFNINLDPLFLDPERGDFRLHPDSPCIDAGNMDLQRDPDGSWVDIGTFYFDHGGGDPRLVVDPEFIEAEGSSEHVVNIANDGDGRLWWRAFVDAEWVTFEPPHGVILPGADIDLFVIINVDDFDIGFYEATLVINSNDPESPNFEIPINVRIGGENIRAIHVSLAEGWNVISINLDPLNCYAEGEDRGPDILRMFMLYDDSVILLKDEQGRFYAPEVDHFINIPFWNLTEGYLVKVRQDVEMVWSGEAIAANADIPLHDGWNMIAYYPNYVLDASAPEFYVLSPIIDHVLLAKDNDGRFMLPEFNYSGMVPWCEGQGYQIKVDEAVVLNYPQEREELAVVSLEDQINPRHWTVPSSTSENMSVLILDCELVTTEFQNPIQNPKSNIQNYEVGAFAPSGLCVGSAVITGTTDRNVCPTGRVMCGMAVWGDDPTTEEIDGLREDEAFALRLWDEDREIETDLFIISIHTGEGLVYNPDGFVAVEAAVPDPVPDEFYLMQNYPNPFNSVTLLEYGLPEASDVKIRVYDLAGRLVTALVDGEQSAGNHTAVWDARTAPAGLYFCRMEFEAFSKTLKLVIVR